MSQQLLPHRAATAVATEDLAVRQLCKHFSLSANPEKLAAVVAVVAAAVAILQIWVRMQIISRKPARVLVVLGLI